MDDPLSVGDYTARHNASANIRESIRDTVDSLLWLETVGSEQLTLFGQSSSHSRAVTDDGDDFSNVHGNETKKPERCIICTLPYGTCEHDEAWLEVHEQERLVRGCEDELEKEIDDMLDVLKFSPVDVATAPSADDIDLEHMQWHPLDEQLTDKIGRTPAKLFIPDRRAWHTCTPLNDETVVVFGGMRSAEELPQPFSAASEGVELLNDVRIYDVPRRCWLGSRATGPAARFGHCAVALSNRRLLLFGGRGDRNKLLNDAWVYELEGDAWYQVAENADGPMPSPRFHCEMASMRFPGGEEVVYLFGGTNGLDNFDDLWQMHIPGAGQDGFRWIRGAAVGAAPSARYGHRMTAFPSQRCLFVTGGCSASPQSELVGHTNSTDTNIELMRLANVLQQRYREESELALVASESLRGRVAALPTDPSALRALGGATHLSSLLKDSADVSAQLHLREQDTRLAEQQLVDGYKRSQATLRHNARTQPSGPPASRREGGLETFCLQLKAPQDLVWQQLAFPSVAGEVPTARAWHGAAALGAFLFVAGGGEPTSLALRHVDRPAPPSPAAAPPVLDGYTPMEVYVLDTHTRAWRHHKPVNSLSLHRDLLALAHRDVAAARRRRDAERLTARSLGLPEGQPTRELALAEALLRVCEWRRDRMAAGLRRAQTDGPHPAAGGEEAAAAAADGDDDDDDDLAAYRVVSPYARLGCSLCAVRQRLLLVGGFPAPDGFPPGPGRNSLRGLYGAPRGAMAFKHRAMVLDVEQPLERRRRLEVEHAAQLEAERRRLEADDGLRQLLAAHELREVVVAERRNRQRELADMARMDFLSALPPLSRGPAVHLAQANRHTLWLRWERVHRDTRRRLLDEDDVVYFLYVRVGYEALCKDCRVRVLPRELPSLVPQSAGLGLGLGLGLHLLAPPSSPRGKSRAARRRRQSLAGGSDPGLLLSRFLVFDDLQPRFAGRVCKAHGDGTFDVKYDDGAFEARVPRYRLRRAAAAAAAAASATNGPEASGSLTARSVGSAAPSLPDQDSDEVSVATTVLTAPSTASRRQARRDDQRHRLLRELRTRFREPVLQNPAAELPLKSRTSAMLHVETKTHAYYRLLVRPDARDGDNGQGNGSGGDDDYDVQSCLSNRTNLPDTQAFEPRDDNSAATGDASHVQRVLPAASGPSASPSLTPTPTPTVVVDADWRLVYAGKQTSYACTNLVPDHILLTERDLKVPVIACVQVLGADYPRYERSQLGPPQAFFTLAADEIGGPSEDTADDRTVDSRSAVSTVSDSTTARATALSKTRRDIVTAVLADQQVARIERRATSCSAEGMGEDYL